MWFYRILYVFDALVALILIVFFVDGLQYEAGNSYFSVWLPLLGVPLVTLTTASILRANAQNLLSTILVALLALPPLAYVLFFGLLLMTNASWH